MLTRTGETHHTTSRRRSRGPSDSSASPLMPIDAGTTDRAVPTAHLASSCWPRRHRCQPRWRCRADIGARRRLLAPRPAVDYHDFSFQSCRKPEMQSCQTLKRHASAAFFEAPSPAFRTPPRPYRELLGPELPGEALGPDRPGLLSDRTRLIVG
jgi:hypothetical protein